MPDPNLSGRVAIVTGAGRGRGRATALGLARAGVSVVATSAREAQEIDRVAHEATGAPGRIFALVADATKEVDASRAVDAALQEFGRLDIVVNNAGRGVK